MAINLQRGMPSRFRACQRCHHHSFSDVAGGIYGEADVGLTVPEAPSPRQDEGVPEAAAPVSAQDFSLFSQTCQTRTRPPQETYSNTSFSSDLFSQVS